MWNRFFEIYSKVRGWLNPTPKPISQPKVEPKNQFVGATVQQQAAYRSAVGRVDRVEIVPQPPPAIVNPISPAQAPSSQDFQSYMEAGGTREKPADVGATPAAAKEYRECAPDLTRVKQAAPVKRPLAKYYDDEGHIQTIGYKELEDDQIFLNAKCYDLFSPDFTERLQVRDGKNGIGVRHFWTPSDDPRSNVTRIVKADNRKERKENDPRHNQRINEFVSWANGVRPFQIVTFDWKDYNKKRRGLKLVGEPDARTILSVEHWVIANVKKYEWRANAEYTKLGDMSVCPDFLGKSSGEASEINPLIVGEVVKSNYPSPAKWEAYLQWTKDKPTVVVFDFVQDFHPNYFLHVRRADKEKGRPQNDVRAVYYLWKGSAWQNTKRLVSDDGGECTIEEFKKITRRAVAKRNARASKAGLS